MHSVNVNAYLPSLLDAVPERRRTSSVGGPLPFESRGVLSRNASAAESPFMPCGRGDMFRAAFLVGQSPRHPEPADRRDRERGSALGERTALAPSVSTVPRPAPYVRRAESRSASPAPGRVLGSVRGTGSDFGAPSAPAPYRGREAQQHRAAGSVRCAELEATVLRLEAQVTAAHEALAGAARREASRQQAYAQAARQSDPLLDRIAALEADVERQAERAASAEARATAEAQRAVDSERRADLAEAEVLVLQTRVEGLIQEMVEPGAPLRFDEDTG